MSLPCCVSQSKTCTAVAVNPVHHSSGSWLQMIFASKDGGSPQHFRQMYDKKVNLLGLIALMTLPEEATPPPLQTAWPQLMAGTMRLLTTLKEQQVRPSPAFSVWVLISPLSMHGLVGVRLQQLLHACMCGILTQAS